jgi:Fe-S cluster assembly protein SufD
LAIDSATAIGISRETVQTLSHAKGEPEWLGDLRLEAFDTFEKLPMPDRQDEEWRRTDIRGLKLEDLVSNPESSGVPASPLGLEGGAYGGHVFHANGRTTDSHLERHLTDQGVILCSLDQAVKDHGDLVRRHLMTRAVAARSGKFAALNGALWSGGTFVYVPRDVDCAIPLRTLYGLEGARTAVFPRTLIVLEARARLTYVEEYASGVTPGVALSGGVVEMFVGDEAGLTLVTLQEYGEGIYDINTQRALLQRDSWLDWLVIGLGDGITKSNIDVALQGRGARTQMLGVLWGSGKAHTNYQTLQDHQAPNCTSDLLYKATLMDESVSVFSGKIRVEKDAQGTDSYQANRTVLLSDKTAAFPSPNLEIEANDVRCTHGASVGKVDAEQLFYLMSRGLSKDIATKMIVEGFFDEVLEREPGAAVRDNLRDLIRSKIEEQSSRS